MTTPATPPVFHLNDVMLSLKGNAGDVDILRGISMDVHAGETLALTGASGSGKSSLLMVMGGLEQATGGQITALGQDLSYMSEDALAQFRQGRMGIVFQSLSPDPNNDSTRKCRHAVRTGRHARCL